MQTTIIFLAFLTTVSFAALSVYPVKKGDPLELYLGPGITKWGRTRKDNLKEYLSACEDEDHSDKCTHWVTEKGDLVRDDSGIVRVFNNGSLLIDSASESDAGAYYAPEELERITQLLDGTFAAYPRTLINVKIY